MDPSHSMPLPLPVPARPSTGSLKTSVAVCTGFWGLLWAIDALKDRVASVQSGGMTWTQIGLDTGPWYVPWLVLTPVFLWTVRRLTGGSGVQAAVVGVLVAAVMASLHIVLASLAYEALVHLGGRPDVMGVLNRLRDHGYRFWLFDFLTAGGLLLALYAARMFAEVQIKAVAEANAAARASHLASRMAEVRLDALRAQLNPHFLFNTLNSIASLLELQDTRRAKKMLVNLGGLLRTQIRSSPDLVPLAEELRFLRRYIDIEQMRFGDQLRFDLECSNESRHALVPSLILQPLVENAIRHGRGKGVGPLVVAVTAVREGQALVVAVRDTGAGLTPKFREGIGLTNTRERLALMYGERASLVLTAGDGGGVEAELRLPFETHSHTPMDRAARSLPEREEPTGVRS